MKKITQPHEVVKYFFQSLMQNQCHVCWGLFSDKSQKEFIHWTLKDIYAQNTKAAKVANLGTPEVKLMFETNNLDLIIRFWRRFVRYSRAMEFHRYAYFETTDIKGKVATVEARLIYENGREERLNLMMFHERGGWRFGYLESDIGF